MEQSNALDYYTLLTLPMETLLNISQNNNKFNSIIDNDTFWNHKVQRDYGNQIKLDNINWKTFYTKLHKNSRDLPLFVDGKKIGVLWITNNTTLSQLINDVIMLFRLDDHKYKEFIFNDSNNKHIFTFIYPILNLDTSLKLEQTPIWSSAHSIELSHITCKICNTNLTDSLIKNPSDTNEVYTLYMLCPNCQTYKVYT